MRQNTVQMGVRIHKTGRQNLTGGFPHRILRIGLSQLVICGHICDPVP